MILKYAACLFATVTLAGCCSSGTTCDAPMVGPNVAWDGLGPAPEEIAPARKAGSRPRKNAVQPNLEVPSDSKPQTKEEWQRQEAQNRADDARLASQLRICSGCSTAPDKTDGSTSSIRH